MKNWDMVNEIISVNLKKCSFSSQILSDNGSLLINPLDIANNFDNYFVNIAPSLSVEQPKFLLPVPTCI